MNLDILIVPLLEGEELQKYLQERKRGCGSHRSKKDYRRKEKHQKKYC